MKHTLILALTAFMTVNSFAATTLNLDYSSLEKGVKACRKTIYGCTAEQEIEIARWNGGILSSYELDGYLSQDTAKSIFIPLSLTNTELLTLAAATSLGVVAFTHDQEIMDVVQKHNTAVTAPIATVGNFIGSGSGLVTVAAGSYFLGVLYKDNKLKQAGLFMVGASMAQGIVTEAFKRTFGRDRPIKGTGPYSFFDNGNKSFYSGHSAEAFTMATVISEMYKDDYPIVPWVAYGLATVTAYARVHDQAHWASDVIVGAIAGHLITKLAMSAFNGNKDDRGGLEVVPSIDPVTKSFMVYANWTERVKEQPLKCSTMPEGMTKVDACLAEALSKK
jgi:membrane-associated phospholipid phosphatase